MVPLSTQRPHGCLWPLALAALMMACELSCAVEIGVPQQAATAWSPFYSKRDCGARGVVGDRLRPRNWQA